MLSRIFDCIEGFKKFEICFQLVVKGLGQYYLHLSCTSSLKTILYWTKYIGCLVYWHMINPRSKHFLASAAQTKIFLLNEKLWQENGLGHLNCMK